MDTHFIQFQRHGDARGQLVALEENKEIPFAIKRVYYMYDTGANVRRGYHAHRTLQQVLVCTSGSCKILLDDGAQRKTVTLDNPETGLYIGNNVWREMYDFTPGTVLMVMASQLYDEADYIRDYQQFLRYVQEQGHQ